MPPTRRAPRNPAVSRTRRFLLLELPAWSILAVGVAYTSSAGGSRLVVVLQLLLLSASLTWLAGGRLNSINLGGLFFGWAAGTLAMFNLLALASIGVFILPVTAFVLVVLVLLLAPGGPRPAAAAGGGAALAVLTQAIALGLLSRST